MIPMRSTITVLLLLLLSSVSYAQHQTISDRIGSEYVSKLGLLTFGSPLKTHKLEGDELFKCIDLGKDIVGEYGVLQSMSDTTVIVQSYWKLDRFEKFTTKSYYDDLVKRYGKKATSKAYKGSTSRGMPIPLFIIARGEPTSWRTHDSRYGTTDILIYMYSDNYESYTFKNGKLESSNEGY